MDLVCYQSSPHTVTFSDNLYVHDRVTGVKPPTLQQGGSNAGKLAGPLPGRNCLPGQAEIEDEQVD